MKEKKLLSLTNNHDTKICVWIKTPYETCINRKGKPKFIVDSYNRKFQNPTLEEGWDEIIEVVNE